MVADWNQQIIEEFRANGGTVETMGFGRGLVLVHHLGARSGTERVSPVANVREPDGSRLIAASKAGAPDNPDWYHNLIAHPDVTIETPEGTEQVHVTDLKGAER
ncbi:MAG: nitroreductase/quinone reductase family protein, partial [Janthinobacterium lividum]